ncbi:multidrug export protein MepA [Anaerotignum neopropionicum]|uniref:Multidrug export protein MepA n=1 Tax=Anaerotignum neopropionicum TaxID=36847 RepID=A0A136WB33_9FIRM|nr:MATE family efflux transporter [Anaerotignum neopropionicum]KXL51721.1 multidrug export protein MepA [Anaerotignum neopropionicum]
MQNELAKDFNLSSLLRFTLPTITMLIFVATYTIVDGIFVSRYVGTTALSAANIVFPLINIMMGIGIMLGAGGSAVIGRTLGEGRIDDARRSFTLIIIFAAALGLVFSAFCFIFITPLCRLLGADAVLLPYCVDYGKILMSLYFVAVIQVLFQTLFVTAGKPHLGLWLNAISGIANIFFDYLFIVVMDWGIAGAAWGTASSFLIGGLFPLWYFAKPRAILFFVKPRWDGKVILNSILNGSSEMVTSGAMAVTTFLFNLTMMKTLGQNGVAAVTIILYAQFLFSSAYMGFASGVAPIFSFIYGNRNAQRMKKMFQLCLRIILVSSVAISIFSFYMATPTIAIFTPKNTATYEIALHGYHIFAWGFLFAGINIFTSSLFTALSNGKLSAIISFLRTFFFVTLCILFLPHVFGINGVWLAIPIAEGLTAILAVSLLYSGNKLYHYLQ